MQAGRSIVFALAIVANASSRATDLTRETSCTASELPACAIALKMVENRQMNADELEQRGKGLRAALERIYNESHGFSAHGTDVTQAVLPYIPIGTSFDDAETILRNAGFIVSHRPDLTAPPDLNRKDWYWVNARISPFAGGGLSSTTIDLFVSLEPRSPGDYSAVAKLSAAFFLSMP